MFTKHDLLQSSAGKMSFSTLNFNELKNNNLVCGSWRIISLAKRAGEIIKTVPQTAMLALIRSGCFERIYEALWKLVTCV